MSLTFKMWFTVFVWILVKFGHILILVVKYDSGMLHVRRDRGQFWSCNFILLFIGTSCSRVYWDTLSKVFFSIYINTLLVSVCLFFLLFLKNVKTSQTYHGNLQDPRKIWPGKKCHWQVIIYWKTMNKKLKLLKE